MDHHNENESDGSEGTDGTDEYTSLEIQEYFDRVLEHRDELVSNSTSFEFLRTYDVHRVIDIIDEYVMGKTPSIVPTYLSPMDEMDMASFIRTVLNIEIKINKNTVYGVYETLQKQHPWMV